MQPNTSTMENIIVAKFYTSNHADEHLWHKYLRFKKKKLQKKIELIFFLKVIFIDYGNTQEVDIVELKYLPESLRMKPPQAMECVLANIQPSVMENPRGLWTERANQFVRNKIDGATLMAKIYSVVNNVVHLEVYKSQYQQDVTLNEILIERGFAQPAEESYLSKVFMIIIIQSKVV